VYQPVKVKPGYERVPVAGSCTAAPAFTETGFVVPVAPPSLNETETVDTGGDDTGGGGDEFCVHWA